MKVASVLLALVLACGSMFASEKSTGISSTVRLSNTNELLLPVNYRNWISVSPDAAGLPSHRHKHVAGKLFVEPSAYEHFSQTGHWPNKTVIVLELRSKKPMQRARGGCDLMGLEAAVKDESRFPDSWSYYGIVYDQPNASAPTKLQASECLDCEHPLDSMLAMAYPTLRAVINAKPSAMYPTLF
jgi:hypothetical protein